MSIRRLAIAIDCTDVTCGACHRRIPPTLPGRPSTCGVFGVGLATIRVRVREGHELGDVETVEAWRRLTGCLAAEAAGEPGETAAVGT